VSSKRFIVVDWFVGNMHEKSIHGEMIANYGLSGEWRMECVSPAESRLFICFSTEFLDERVDLLTLVSTK
jgi:hypothetical protein